MSRTVSAVIPVFRDADRAANAAASVSAQQLPEHTSLEVIVVDDGSGDDTTDRLREVLPSTARLIALPENRGRSAARQAGIAAATGEAVLFLDCDCEPSDREFVARHLQSLATGAVASIGPVIGCDGGFWDRYQRRSSERRRMLFDKGVGYAGSSQNMMVRADALRAVGGFDTRYRHYGFEDRDLLVKLTACGTITWCDAAVIRHLDRITMSSVAEKMRAAGRETSRLFASQYPVEYRTLGYASIDAQERAWLKVPTRLLHKCPAAISRAFDCLERHRLLPWVIAFPAARVIGAASYLVGTVDAKD
jgi:glycosyltransferase involved in cell wall biosynthesis